MSYREMFFSGKTFVKRFVSIVLCLLVLLSQCGVGLTLHVCGESGRGHWDVDFLAGYDGLEACFDEPGDCCAGHREHDDVADGCANGIHAESGQERGCREEGIVARIDICADSFMASVKCPAPASKVAGALHGLFQHSHELFSRAMCDAIAGVAKQRATNKSAESCPLSAVGAAALLCVFLL